MATKPRIALTVEEPGLLRQPRSWLGSACEILVVARGRHLASDLAAARPDLIVLEAVHPSEGPWLAAWLRTQPGLSRMPLLLILPFGPAPKPAVKGVRFVIKPLTRPRVKTHVGSLLRGSYCRPR